MKKCLTFFLLLMMIFCQTVAFAQSDIQLQINGTIVPCDVAPVIVADRTLVPARALFEPLGATLSWDGSIRQAAVSYAGNEILLRIDSDTAYINGQAVKLEVPAKIIGDRTMFPVRFVAETLGFQVGWIPQSRTVTIDSPKPQSTNQIIDIRLDVTQETISYSVFFSEPLAGYSDFTLEAPERIVVDFSDLQIGIAQDQDLTEGQLSGVRFGRHGDSVRLVLDLTQKSSYSVQLTQDGTCFTVTMSNMESQEPPAATATPAPPPAVNPGTWTVVIDAGHGGKDPGALGKDGDTVVAQEKDINLAVALGVQRELESAGVNVLMTRTEDVYPSNLSRAELANTNNADLYVAIHTNSVDGNPDANGSLVLYGPTKDSAITDGSITSKELGALILEGLCGAIGTNSQGTREGDEFIVINKTTMPSVIVELGFITNLGDRAILMDDAKRQDAARGIAQGILRALEKVH